MRCPSPQVTNTRPASPASPFPVSTKLSGMERMKAIAYGGPEAARYQVRDLTWLDDPQPNWSASWDDRPDETPSKCHRQNNPNVDEGAVKARADAAAEEKRVKREALIAESKRLEQKYQETQARIRQREQDNERLAKKLAEMKAENDAWNRIWDTTAARLGITNATVARKEAKLIQLVKMVDALANHIVDFDNDDEVQGGDVQGSEVQGGDAQGDEVQGGGAPEAGGQ
jgi:hypothetical protein